MQVGAVPAKNPMKIRITVKNENRMLISLIVILTSIVLADCGGSGGVREVTQTQFMESPDDIRGFRLCEVVPVFRDKATFTAEIFYTVGLKDFRRSVERPGWRNPG
jgi:hypothetical protein